MHSVDYAVARCLSVCPSVCYTPVFCVHGYTIHISSKFFYRRVAPPFSFFHTKRGGWQYSDGDTPNGGVEGMGGMKNTIFDQYLTLSRE